MHMSQRVIATLVLALSIISADMPTTSAQTSAHPYVLALRRRP